MTSRQLLSASGVVVLLLACASRGSQFDPDSVTRISLGKTTQADVRRIFGSPTRVMARGSGGTAWTYLHEERQTKSTSTLARIGAFLATLANRRVIVPPVNVSYSTTTRYDLTVYFDDAGYVWDYDYERTVIPEKSIY